MAASTETPCCGPERHGYIERAGEVRRQAFALLGEEGLIEFLDSRCLAQSDVCKPCLERGDCPSRFAAEVLEDFGGRPTLELLARAHARRLDLPISAETLLLRMMKSSPAYAACAPPSEQELASLRAELDGFLVIDERAGALTPRRPTAAELDDLAYLMVTVREAGPEVGKLAAGEVHGTRCEGPLDEQQRAERQRLARAIDVAFETGSVAATADAERAFLRALGYPGAIEVCRDAQDRWTGSWHSTVMRNLAHRLETLGDTEEAEALYRRANPGGGRCGTGVYGNWREQLEGAIRAGERSRGCRRVAAERLLAVSAEYGPERLVGAGYDLERLYRGALLTRNRSLDAGALRRVLGKASPDLAERALARLSERGTEDWERRLFALEGFADTAQRRALEPLVAVLPVLGERERSRALSAIGELAQRFSADPCPGYQVGLSLSSGVYERTIRSLGRSCATRLDDAEAEELSRRLAGWLKDPSAKVREAAAAALGKVASAWSRRVLVPLAQNDPAVFGQVCNGYGCGPHYPVREAAQEALEAIDAAYRAPSEASPELQ